jgi:prevent-host-death family protein
MSESYSLLEARAHFGDLVIRAQGGKPSVITRYGKPAAMIVPLGDQSGDNWNEAIDWLLNSRHCADPGIQAAFWGIAEGKCTRENVEEWVAAGGGQEFA